MRKAIYNEHKRKREECIVDIINYGIPNKLYVIGF